MDCYSCRWELDLPAAPEAEKVYVGSYWRVVHATRCPVPGWLIVLPRRHTTSIAEHTGAEAAELGQLLVATSAAIQAHTGCAKTYVAQFAEAAGFSHTHFHVIPRSAELAADRIGPAVFSYLQSPDADHLPPGRRNELALALRPLIAAQVRRLAGPGGGPG